MSLRFADSRPILGQVELFSGGTHIFPLIMEATYMTS